MKKKLLYLGLSFITAALLFTISCGEEDDDETCGEEDICDGKTVTACCSTDNSGDYACVYKYNGVEYPESEIDDLADVLGCSSTKSTNYDEDNEYVIAALEALMEKVKCNCSKDKD